MENHFDFTSQPGRPEPGKNVTASQARSGETFPAHLWRRKRIAISGALALTALMAGYAFFGYIPKYSSEALVMIKDSVLTSRYVTAEDYATTSAAATSSVLNTMSLLGTRRVSDGMYMFLKTKHPEELKRLNIENSAGWDRFFKDGSQFIKARNKPGTDVISVKFTWTDSPVITQEGLGVVLKSFQDASAQVNRAEQEGRYDYLRDQSQRVRAELDQTRQKITAIKRDTNTVNIDKKTEEMTVSRIAMQRELSQTESDAAATRAKLARYQKAVGLSPADALIASALGNNPNLAKIYDHYYELSRELAKTSTTYTEQSPEVSAIASQLAQAKADMQSELKRTLGENASKALPVYTDEAHMTTISEMVATQANATQLATKASELKRELASMDAALALVPAVEESLSDLKLEETSISDSLKTLRAKLLEAQLKEAQTLSNVFVIDPPSFPYKANAPTQLHLIALGFLMGLAGTTALIYWGWRKNQSRTLVTEQGAAFSRAEEVYALRYEKNGGSHEKVLNKLDN